MNFPQLGAWKVFAWDGRRKEKETILFRINERSNKYKTSNGVNLTDKKCVPCEGGIPPLTKDQAEKYLKEVSEWIISSDGLSIERKFNFKNFKEAIGFVNKVADLAESEGHHPDIEIFSYKNVRVNLSTHAIGGLSENDFILAAKIDEIL